MASCEPTAAPLSLPFVLRCLGTSGDERRIGLHKTQRVLAQSRPIVPSDKVIGQDKKNPRPWVFFSRGGVQVSEVVTSESSRPQSGRTMAVALGEALGTSVAIVGGLYSAREWKDDRSTSRRLYGATTCRVSEAFESHGPFSHIARPSANGSGVLGRWCCQCLHLRFPQSDGRREDPNAGGGTPRRLEQAWHYDRIPEDHLELR